MLTQTISAPAGRALNERPTQIPPPVDQFGALAVCAGVITTGVKVQEGRRDLRRGRARCVLGSVWRRSHLCKPKRWAGQHDLRFQAHLGLIRATHRLTA